MTKASPGAGLRIGWLVAGALAVIERMYNALYLAYLAIFSVAFWCVAIGTAGLVRRLGDGAALPWAPRTVASIVP